MSKRILMVEDTEDNRQIVRDLMSTTDYELIEAVDGADGVAMAAQHKPDLILMDIQLPVIDGYEATRRIKADPALRHIPIIAVTSYALSGDEGKDACRRLRWLRCQAVQPAPAARQDSRIPSVRELKCAIRLSFSPSTTHRRTSRSSRCASRPTAMK